MRKCSSTYIMYTAVHDVRFIVLQHNKQSTSFIEYCFSYMELVSALTWCTWPVLPRFDCLSFPAHSCCLPPRTTRYFYFFNEINFLVIFPDHIFILDDAHDTCCFMWNVVSKIFDMKPHNRIYCLCKDCPAQKDFLKKLN